MLNVKELNVKELNVKETPGYFLADSYPYYVTELAPHSLSYIQYPLCGSALIDTTDSTCMRSAQSHPENIATLYYQSYTILQGTNIIQWLSQAVMTRGRTCDPQMRGPALGPCSQSELPFLP